MTMTPEQIASAWELVNAYPWHSLDAAESQARALLTEIKETYHE